MLDQYDKRLLDDSTIVLKERIQKIKDSPYGTNVDKWAEASSYYFIRINSMVKSGTADKVTLKDLEKFSKVMEDFFGELFPEPK